MWVFTKTGFFSAVQNNQDSSLIHVRARFKGDLEKLCKFEVRAHGSGVFVRVPTLLSGGEKTLTVAAILFAILKVRPMPFCLLDEIEAALDEANADRIARFLKKFSESTQFIVITHKKPTMEAADVLYGVTMEEKGVSKIVSVKLADAIKQAEQGN